MQMSVKTSYLAKEATGTNGLVIMGPVIPVTIILMPVQKP